MSNIVAELKQGQNLSLKNSKSLFSDLMEGKHEENQIIEILEALIKKGETKDELDKMKLGEMPPKENIVAYWDTTEGYNENGISNTIDWYLKTYNWK